MLNTPVGTQIKSVRQVYPSVQDRAAQQIVGHLVGDEVLRQVGQRLLAVLRPYDTVGRYGGEEFLMVLPGCDIETTTALAERLRRSVAAEPVAWDEGRIHVTLSLGVDAWEIKGHDAAPTLGATIHGQKIGTFADLTCFSFHPRKSITTGEGGLITTEHDALAERLKTIRSHAAKVCVRTRLTCSSPAVARRACRRVT